MGHALWHMATVCQSYSSRPILPPDSAGQDVQRARGDFRGHAVAVLGLWVSTNTGTTPRETLDLALEASGGKDVRMCPARQHPVAFDDFAYRNASRSSKRPGGMPLSVANSTLAGERTAKSAGVLEPPLPAREKAFEPEWDIQVASVGVTPLAPTIRVGSPSELPDSRSNSGFSEPLANLLYPALLGLILNRPT